MPKKALIAYASKTGSTKEVAEFISDNLISKHFDTLVMHVDQVKNVKLFDVVILGTSLRLDKPLHESINFAQKFSRDLKNIPVACFALGLTMKESNEETKQKTLSMLQPLLSKISGSVEVGMFGGKVDHQKLPWFWRLLAKKDDSGLMDEGDWRDWDEIKLWTDSLEILDTSEN